jgi:hypothetical protein
MARQDAGELDPESEAGLPTHRRNRPGLVRSPGNYQRITPIRFTQTLYTTLSLASFNLLSTPSGHVEILKQFP